MNRLSSALVFFLSASVLYAGESKTSEELHGKVSSVTDGDTLVFRTDKQVLNIRLEGIDAPENSQPHGSESKEALKSLVAGKQVTVQKTGLDKYGRTLGIVMVDGKSVNLKLVETGNAWHYKKYNSDKALSEGEAQSKAAKRGLWASTNPLPPWDYRANAKAEFPTTTRKLKTTPKPKDEPAEVVPSIVENVPPKTAGTISSGKYKESEAEKAYERANGVEVVHKKDGTTYERKARSKK